MTAAESNDRPPKRSRGIIIALALSLTLNVFIIAGLGWAHIHFAHPPLGPMQRFQSASHEMHLGGAQLAAFRGMLVSLRQHRRAMFEKNRPLFDQIWDQLAKPQPDDKTIADLIAQADTNRLAFQKEATAAMESFLATLNPEQRAQFADLAKWPNPVPPHP